MSRAVREERGEYYSAPAVQETANRYNVNDGASKRVHELRLAVGIVICFDHAIPKVGYNMSVRAARQSRAFTEVLRVGLG